MDFYLEMCVTERGEHPEKPFSGKFILRVSPELHRSLAVEAEARKTSLNALAETAIERFLGGSERKFPACSHGDRSNPARGNTNAPQSATEKTS